jgi:PKD repeat protein
MTLSSLARLAIVGCLLVAAGCGDARAPTVPTPPSTPAPGSGLEVAFTLAVDALGSQDALTGVSEVTVDASVSPGSKLRYLVDFGDGTTATQAVARHVYATAGRYQVTVTVTDAAGRTATSSRSLVVASPLGTWLYSGYLALAQTVEVRTLTLTAQEGLTVRGTLKRAGEQTAITGTLTEDRRVRLVADHPPETLEGAVPSRLSGNRAAWVLTSRGGPADGETLAYTPVDEPSGPGPDAVLKVRFFSFSAPYAIAGISPILFDGSTSRGEGLTYFIEFGDGQVETSSTAVHPIDKAGEYTAQLTVVDRFGRLDSETVAFRVRTLVICCGGSWKSSNSIVSSSLTIRAQNGSAIAGTFDEDGHHAEFGQPFTGAVDADGSVRLTIEDSGVTLDGKLTLGPYWDSPRLVLRYVSGPHNGTTLTFYFDDGPG